ncbi:MAG TPA: hypothetical protein VKV18_07515 [Chthonomonas sp.]|uniref:hypothetical protein n=1 Tax=Chthonomonas sp. TaxID=2282153 RepID=UPI002B4B2E68|nr:hypothetical protein [Chthonomonas sp.]HLI48514.1 hypothetical protein [Chthonomonas sp.]
MFHSTTADLMQGRVTLPLEGFGSRRLAVVSLGEGEGVGLEGKGVGLEGKGVGLEGWGGA